MKNLDCHFDGRMGGKRSLLLLLFIMFVVQMCVHCTGFRNIHNNVMADDVIDQPKIGNHPVNERNSRVTQSGGMVVWPENLVRPGIHNNSFLIILPVGQSRKISEVVVNDIYNTKSYQCSKKELGCSYNLVDDGLLIRFDTDIQVPLGEIIISRSAARLLAEDGHRQLQEDTSVLRVPNFALMKGSWVRTASYVMQIIVFIFRLPFSVFMFWKYPFISLLMDQVATHFTILSLFRGPFVAVPEVILQMVSHTKILPFFFANPFEQWEPATVRCVPKPMHASHELYCSFFDNYGQNIIALGGIALVTTLIHFCIGCALKSSKVKGKLRTILSVIKKYYGPVFLVAKLDANHMEVIMFSLINYSVTDTSSTKWIVGVSLSGVLFLGLLGFSGWVTITNLQIFKLRRGNTRVLPLPNSQHPIDTEVQALDEPASASRKGPTRVNSEAVHSDPKYLSNPWKKLTLYVHQNTQESENLWEIFWFAAKYIRTIGLCVLVLNDLKNPVVQILIGIAIEALYLIYLIAANNRLAPLEYIVSWLQQLCSITYLIMKVISTDVTLTVSEVHWTQAWVMGGLLSAMVVFGILTCLLSIAAVWYKPLVYWTKQAKPDLIVYLDAPEAEEPSPGVQLDDMQSRTGSAMHVVEKPNEIEEGRESKVEAIPL